MFKSLKKFFCGDQRPIDRKVVIDGLGSFTYVDEEEKWRLPASQSEEIDILIDGDWSDEQEVIRPHPRLVDRTRSMRERPAEFRETLFVFIDSVDTIDSEKKAELKERDIEAIRLFVDKSGKELGTLSFDYSNDRHYYVDYENGEPGMLGCDG
jgi:hypothetical protein